MERVVLTKNKVYISRPVSLVPKMEKEGWKVVEPKEDKKLFRKKDK